MPGIKLVLICDGADVHLEGARSAVFKAMKDSRFKPLHEIVTAGRGKIDGQVGEFAGLPLLLRP